MAVQNVDCVFTYFCGESKNNFRLQFRCPFKDSRHRSILVVVDVDASNTTFHQAVIYFRKKIFRKWRR